MQNFDKVWQSVLGELELLISKANFTTWFKNTFIIEISDQEVVVGVPNSFTKVWLEKKYHDKIAGALENILSKNNLQVIYRVQNKSTFANTSKKVKVEVHKKVDGVNKLINNNNTSSSQKFGLSGGYNFNSFVVGPGNELAQAAAQAAAQKPGLIYNPLFIYGGVGLGKTHLVQAVGNYILSKNPGRKVLYINSEKFTNDFIMLSRVVIPKNLRKFTGMLMFY